ncbi:MAG: DUF433 domain-containing protein [Anaerolineae bacterium]|nr:DUF433 domain-containing protein [Anaerolineae bacterium]
MIAQKHLIAGESVDHIAEHYGITLADVYAALAYYHDNLAYFEQQEAELEPLADDARRYTAELKARINERLEENQEN